MFSFIGFGLGIFLLCAGIVLIFYKQPNHAYIFIALGGGMILGWSISTYFARRQLKQRLSQVILTGQILAEKDTQALSDALASLTQGDLTHQLTFQSSPIAITAQDDIGQLAQTFNKVIIHLSESADAFNTVTDEPCRRLCYVGTDSYFEGAECAEAMGESLVGCGEVAIIMLNFSSPAHILRRKGFESRLHDKYPAIQVIEVLENFGKLENSRELTLSLLKRHPHLSGIYITDGGTPFAIARVLTERALAGKVKLIVHDLVDETMEYVKRGVVTATFDQDPFAQGYNSVMHVFNHLATGWKPPNPRLIITIQRVTQENYHLFWQPGKGAIQSKQNERPLPMQPASKPLRIAVLGREESIFWEPVKAGVFAATEVLRHYNATVEWLIPEQHRMTGDISAATYNAALEEAVNKGFHAVVTSINEQAMVPIINRAVVAGIAVSVFNSEPSSLRGLMEMLSLRSKTLNTVSKKMSETVQTTDEFTKMTIDSIQQMVTALEFEAHGLQNTNQRVRGIGTSMMEIEKSVQDQEHSLEKISKAATKISLSVNQAAQSAQEMATAAVQSTATAQHGTEAVRQTLRQMEQIQLSVEGLADAIHNMNTYSNKIGEIVDTIGDIASQTNLLALNAAIEAARAGQSGKSFAVVATEVRKLADKASTSSKEIGTLIATIQKSIASADEAMQTAARQTEEGSVLAADSGQALDQLLTSTATMQNKTKSVEQANQDIVLVMDNLLESINQISAAIEQNIAVSQNITTEVRETLALVEDATNISQGNTLAMKEIAHSTEQMGEQTQNLEHTAHGLADLSQELQASTAQFKIE